MSVIARERFPKRRARERCELTTDPRERLSGETVQAPAGEAACPAHRRDGLPATVAFRRRLWQVARRAWLLKRQVAWFRQRFTYRSWLVTICKLC